VRVFLWYVWFVCVCIVCVCFCGMCGLCVCVLCACGMCVYVLCVCVCVVCVCVNSRYAVCMWLQALTDNNFAGVIVIVVMDILPVNTTFIHLPNYLFAKINYISLNDTFESIKQRGSSNVNQNYKTWDRSWLAEQLLVLLSEESLCFMKLFCNILVFSGSL